MSGKRLKAFITSGFAWASVARLFREADVDVTQFLDDADVLVFTGGEDVNPLMYGHTRYHNVHANIRRDSIEKDVFDRRQDRPCVGICRGAQLLNVLAGGTLYQDITEHAVGRPHRMVDLVNKLTYDVTSLHHQMMNPTSEADIIGFSEHDFKAVKWDSVAKKFVEEERNLGIEIVQYSDKKLLCYQGHPELPGPDGKMEENFIKLVHGLIH